jgi:hypothetical protein
MAGGMVITVRPGLRRLVGAAPRSALGPYGGWLESDGDRGVC